MIDTTATRQPSLAKGFFTTLSVVVLILVLFCTFLYGIKYMAERDYKPATISQIEKALNKSHNKSCMLVKLRRDGQIEWSTRLYELERYETACEAGPGTLDYLKGL